MADNNDFGSQSSDINTSSNWDKDLVADVGAAPIEGSNAQSMPAADAAVQATEAVPETHAEELTDHKASNTDQTALPKAETSEGGEGIDLNMADNNIALSQNESVPAPVVEAPSESSDTNHSDSTPMAESHPADTNQGFPSAAEPSSEIEHEPNVPESTLPSAEGPMLESKMQSENGQPAGSDVDDDFLNSLLQISDKGQDETDETASQPSAPEPTGPVTPVPETSQPVSPEATAEEPEPVHGDEAVLVERPEEPLPSNPAPEPAEAATPEPPVFPASDQPIDLAHQDGAINPTPPVTTKKHLPWFWIATGIIVVAGVVVYFLVINQSGTYTSQLPTSSNTSSPGVPTSTIQESTSSTTTSTLTADEQRQEDLVAIQKGLEQYYLKTKKYPVSIEPSKTSDANGALKVLVSQYLSELPKDPIDPDRYYGYTSADGKTYELTAVFDSLPSGVTGVKISTGFMVTLSPGVTFADNASSSSLSATTAPAAE